MIKTLATAYGGLCYLPFFSLCNLSFQEKDRKGGTKLLTYLLETERKQTVDKMLTSFSIIPQKVLCLLQLIYLQKPQGQRLCFIHLYDPTVPSTEFYTQLLKVELKRKRERESEIQRTSALTRYRSVQAVTTIINKIARRDYNRK